MNIPELFSDEKVNVGRQVELDIAKALAIIFMIFLHTLMVVQGYNAISGVRHLMGSTDPNKAEVGTIRADFAEVMEYNIVHGSDCAESAEKEIHIYFSEDELYPERKCMSELVIESLDAE